MIMNSVYGTVILIFVSDLQRLTVFFVLKYLGVNLPVRLAYVLYFVPAFFCSPKLLFFHIHIFAHKIFEI